MSLIPWTGGGGGTPGAGAFAIAPPATPSPGAPPSPPIEQVTVDASQSPQQVQTPNISPFTFTPGQLASLEQTPTLTPNGNINPGGGYAPASAPGGGGPSGGGSAGGGPQPQQPQPQQQPQKSDPITLMLNQLFGQTPLTSTIRPGISSGMDVSGPGSTPAGGVYTAGGSPGVVNSLLSPGSTNIWLPLLVGGLLLYAATEG